MANKSRTRRYTPDFKRQVINDIISGRLTRLSARKKYNIPGHGTIDRWLVQSGHGDLSSWREKSQEEGGCSMRHKNTDFFSDDRKKIADLERELYDLRALNDVYHTMIDLAHRELGIDIKKTLGAKYKAILKKSQHTSSM